MENPASTIELYIMPTRKTEQSFKLTAENSKADG
jgi:hypothetical protein